MLLCFKKIIELVNKAKAIVLFFVLASILFGCVLFVPPMPGVADQGDFVRVLDSCGLSYINQQDYTKYIFKYTVVDFKMEKIPVSRYLMITPSTSQIYPIFIARVICKLIGLEHFNTRVLAVVLGIIFIVSVSIIFRFLLPKNIISKLLLIILFLLIFFDSNYVIWFNSLYGEPIILVSLSFFIVSCLLVIHNINNLNKGHFILLTASSLMLINSKLQCVVLLPVILFFIFRYCLISKRKYIAYLILLILTVYSYGFYHDVGDNFGTNKNTMYHSIFYGLLIDSDNPKKDLADLGLNTDMVLDKGKHSYLPEKEYAKYYPFSEITQKEFYSQISNFKILKFYLTHVDSLYKGLKYTAVNSYNTGTFLGKYEFGGPKDYNSNIRNYAWSFFRQNYFPKNFIFIFIMFLIAILIAIYEYFKSKDLKKRLLIELFCGLLLIGIIQFPMPYILNGHADVAKQLYLFNIIFDILIFSGIYYTCWKARNFYFYHFLNKQGSLK